MVGDSDIEADSDPQPRQGQSDTCRTRPSRSALQKDGFDERGPDRGRVEEDKSPNHVGNEEGVRVENDAEAEEQTTGPVFQANLSQNDRTEPGDPRASSSFVGLPYRPRNTMLASIKTIQLRRSP